ncbi:MAG TPA: isoleucine--tRNA ligase [Bacteroidales bacterium]|nr:isoleucine--tRNA ligase [Bacteroidales bacterium]HNZ43032.1 isoleucine--tRNA ligase [Bacteroidales bacterium]HPB26402.1 isoleucine--tRNA ligase [Bacteroidales bacterium]HPI30782.1 isoleucine--tRNA ligase [Bacteroidales bacterium]HQN17154.1 isoleucine--tRNA ligase [Bacteroidales bacterium]
MKQKYTEYKQLSLTNIASEINEYWQQHDIFQKSIDTRKGCPPFVFYEGPPSANGQPGIHHVMARAIKDIFCRYKTLKGYYVERKAGWDTHGLPIEIAVEKTLGITKEDIGKSITVEEYNQQCRKEVMKYKDQWDDLTVKMGYWVDLENPYITFDNKYIESVWHLLSKLYEKGLLYKGYTIQPYSPAAGTGLSSHELNLPGCYKDVKDNTVVAQFKVVNNDHPLIKELSKKLHGELFILAWTTTPWTLPSNTALAVGSNIDYIAVQSFNQYTHQPITVILAKNLKESYFPEKNAALSMEEYLPENKNIPYRVVAEFKGKQLEEIRYEQLLPYVQPDDGDAFKVVAGDFVTTEDGTGIVHIAPSFGADDFRTARQKGLGSLTLVDKQGKFVAEMGEFAGRYVKNEYDPVKNNEPGNNVDIDIIIKLKKENRAFKSEKYEHSYPHCWRTDKPILYYPLDSWFIKTTACKERMIELNKTINWKPESTGTGRFGNWLENLVDWNLSRTRYWGVPLPIWATEDRSEKICIGSVDQLKKEIEKAVEKGFMSTNPYKDFIDGNNSKENYNTIDLHRPYVDEIVLVSPSGQKMFREPDLIDVWFDSGSMPYAQLHYPFENADIFKSKFPADFIAEGVDQTRGWFFTLHAIAAMLFDSVAFKNVVSNGLVLDKNGNKMSKRLGNGVDPFETISKYGPDATRWYMITNSQPWDNLKFDSEGIGEVQRKFFGTLYNTYAFFALYANIDGFAYQEEEIPVGQRPEIDRWIISELNTLIMRVDECYADYEPTRAGRLIQDFVDEYLSNWYVRLCRRRFWKGDYSKDKISAYQTLYTCLKTIALLTSPIAPFFAEKLFLDLNNVTGKLQFPSVHLAEFPVADNKLVDKDLEERMELAQKISSMVLSLRKKHNLRVRQPLAKIMLPITETKTKVQVEAVKNLILSEVNVKEIEYIEGENNILVKKIKPDFKALGPKFGKQMKTLAAVISAMNQQQINELEKNKTFGLDIDNTPVEISINDVEIITEDIPGWVVSVAENITVALDTTLTPQLVEEGLAREFINRIQTLRKELHFEVTDKIRVLVERQHNLVAAVENNNLYICSEILAVSIDFVDAIEGVKNQIELTDNAITFVSLSKA